MVPLSRGARLAFKHPMDRTGRPGSGSREDTRSEAREPEVGMYILCRSCGHIITHSDERVTVQGAHEHTFANPHGIVYRIVCFRSAVGCGYVGVALEEFTWFRGFNWRVALCSNCLIHVGWLFSSLVSEQFHGLILDRLNLHSEYDHGH